MITLQLWSAIDKEVMDVARTGMSDPCETGSIVVASAAIAPSAPTFSIEAGSAQLILSMVAPTTKENGDNLYAFSKFAIYHSSGSGIDVDNDATYDGVFYSPATNVHFACTAKTYFRITALDTFSNESDPSAEDSETPDAAGGTTLPEDDGLWAHRLGVDSAWTEDSPDTNSVAWASVILYWKDNKYTITNGNTDKNYIWWDYSLSKTTFQTSDTPPTLELEDVVVAYNHNGKVFLAMYSPMVLTDYLRSGTIASQSIVLGITGAEDCEIRAGIAAGDFANAGGVQGFIMGLDQSDSSKAKMYWGGPNYDKWATGILYIVDEIIQNDGDVYICKLEHTSAAASEPGTGGSWTTYWTIRTDLFILTRFMKWTGSVMDINADLVCTSDFLFAGDVSGHISYAVASAGNALDDMVSNDGDNYTGVVTRNYRIKIDDAASSPEEFTWSHDGGATWEATGVAITGAAQTLEDGVTVTFGATVGHALNDYWDFKAGDTTTNIHNVAGVYQIFASTDMPATDTRIKLDGYGLGGGIDLYSGPAAGSHVNLHAEGSISLDASGGA